MALEECRFEKFVVKQDDEVPVFGPYSLERAGLVADANWARQTRVMKGRAERILASLRRRIRNYLFWGVFFVALSRVVYMLIST